MNTEKSDFVAQAGDHGSPVHHALSRLIDAELGKASESLILNKLIELGIAKVEEEMLLSGYAALAAEQESVEERQFRQASMRARNRILSGDVE